MFTDRQLRTEVAQLRLQVGTLQTELTYTRALVEAIAAELGLTAPQPAAMPTPAQQAAPIGTHASGLSPRVIDAIHRGKKIEAIKIHRDETGAGLKEAKDAVEGYLIGW